MRADDAFCMIRMLREKLSVFLESLTGDSDVYIHEVEVVIWSASMSPLDPQHLRQLVGEEIERHSNTNVTWMKCSHSHEGFRYVAEREVIECELNIYRAEGLLDWDEHRHRWNRSEARNADMARLEIEAANPSVVDSIAESLREDDAYETHIKQYS